MAAHRIDLSIRFWRNVETSSDGCWEWKAGKSIYGYGQMNIDNKHVGAHRVSWMLNIGEIPEGLYVCHHCDNPGCVRPDHLFLGTNADNIKDMISKGRDKLTGEKNGMAKLTVQRVKEIKRLTKERLFTRKELAEMFGVSVSTIKAIREGRCWRVV